MSVQKIPDADSHVPQDADSFLHVVIYAGIFLVIGLIVAFVIVKRVGRHIVPGKHAPHPTSQLVLPTAIGPAMASQGVTELPFIFTQQNSKTCV